MDLSCRPRAPLLASVLVLIIHANEEITDWRLAKESLCGIAIDIKTSVNQIVLTLAIVSTPVHKYLHKDRTFTATVNTFWMHLGA